MLLDPDFPHLTKETLNVFTIPFSTTRLQFPSPIEAEVAFGILSSTVLDDPSMENIVPFA